ncbi:hypothetical protein [Paenarthrobacter sp. YJN-5]|uniref:hypothetical protein n=1 Tax=Paenarthrobacter sp. YJN-5 TaxID=2735316 RepID=UPI001877AD03|nr:hypothetical protein [Paenarthrobacter sp. YJN-5]QOT19349.1 hypothetical protein HMI59_22085 [Paenarthrobacter sp. YJN-5]
MTTLTAVPSPAQIPAVQQNATLYLQSRALTGIKQHLLAGGTDTEFMLRLASNALRETPPEDAPDADTRRHARGLKAIHRHLTVGGTDRAILVGLTVNALTGYSPATVKEANEIAEERAAA